MHSTKISIALSAALLLLLTSASAWTGPTSTPPNANAAEPLNVSATSQTKLGNVGAYGLFLTGAAPQYINFSSTLGSTGFGLRNNSGVVEYKNSAGAWTAFGTSQWTTTGSNIHYNTGDVAVGGTVPADKLHVSGNIVQDNANVLRAKNSAGAMETWMWPRFSDNVTYINFGSSGINIRNNASESRLFIQDGGNVGIGDTTPDFKLELEGTASVSNRKIGINDVQVLYLPDQVYSGSIFFGSGGGSLNRFGASDGYNNTGIGLGALHSVTTGYDNTAAGRYSLYTNTTGRNNTAVGANSLLANTTGINNTATGQNSLLGNTTGASNTAYGFISLRSNTTGSNNSSFGVNSLQLNTTGTDNSAFGMNSLLSNTIGTSNTASGYASLLANTSGNNNTSSGYVSLYSNTTGSTNSAFGYLSLYGNTTGNNNTTVGQYSGANITTGSNNLVLGSGAAASSASVNNEIRLGDTQITSFRSQVALTVTSDARLKENVQPVTLGLDFVSKLKPVTYTRIADTSKKTEHGFIAQDVKKLLENSGDTHSGIIAETENIHGSPYLSVRYNDFISILARAIQEITAVSGMFKHELMGWLGSGENGLSAVFTKKLVTRELCVGDTCITEEQFLDMIAASRK